MKVIVIELKTQSIKEYHEEIRKHLQDINNLKIFIAWENQLTISINFVF